MNEKLNHYPEDTPGKEEKPYGDAPKENAERLPSHEELLAEKQVEIDRLTKKIEHEAKSGVEIRSQTDQGPQTGQYHAYGSKRPPAASQTLRRAQKELSPSERQFSKIIHNQKVEAVSDVAGGTIARPSGLLVGGIFSFLTSIVVLIGCNYFGYEYNYAIGLASFIGGFALGLFLELLYRIFRKPKY